MNRQTARQFHSSRFLAVRTIKSAPRRLRDAPDRAPATRTRFPGAIINAQPFPVIIRRAGRAAKIKKPVRFVWAEIQRHGAAALDGFLRSEEHTSELQSLRH